MIRSLFAGFVFITLLFASGCGMSGQQSNGNDDWFKKNNDEFEQQRAGHIKNSSEAVRDYQKYRNQ